MQVSPIATPSTLFKYTFFRLSFIFSLIMLVLYITFLVLAINMCGGNCLYNSQRYFSCSSGGTLYCCSYSSEIGPYSCAWYSDCIFDNDTCGAYNGLSWASGSLLFLGFVLMFVAACRFRSKRRYMMIQQAAYQNLNNQPYYAVQPQYGSPPIVYGNGQPQNANQFVQYNRQ